jgi:hypothetical protein
MTMQEHRKELKELCVKLNNRQANSVEELHGNRALAEWYADENSNVIFRTFEEWNTLGYKILKGQKGFAFWGHPQEFDIRDKKNPSKIKEVGVYCPIVFKFSQNQVTKI